MFVTAEAQSALRVPEPCSSASYVKAPEPQQDAAQSVHNSLSHVELKPEQDAEPG